MSSIIDKIAEDLEALDHDLATKVMNGKIDLQKANEEQAFRNQTARIEKEKTSKPLFTINIQYKEDENSEETSHACFTVRSVSAQSALNQKDVKSFLADNDFIIHLAVNKVGSGVFGKGESDARY